jgi:nucleotidyltransferase-like protein
VRICWDSPGARPARPVACYSSSVHPGYLDEIVAHFHALLQERLVGVVLYGSRARGDAREDSDVDLFLLAEDLPGDLWERARLLHFHSEQPRQPDASIRALTPAEYARDLSALDLDIAIDGRVLWDRDGYTASRLALIRQRLDEAGHYRTADLRWQWRKWPTRADWEINWDRVRV